MVKKNTVVFPVRRKARKTKQSTKKLTRAVKNMSLAPQTPFADVGRILGQSLGNIFNNGTIGANLGSLAGTGIGKIFGSGAYTMNQNTILDSYDANQVPVMHSNSETIVLHHREYIRDVSSAINFTSFDLDINPGLATTFPYLSSIASCFQEYSFKGLVFEFKSTSAEALNSTNTALGSVMLAAQYRADALPFINKQQMLNEHWSTSTRPSCNTLLPIECAPKENPLAVQYVRTGPVPAGQDAKLYDLAQFSFAAVGSQAVAVCGELWATYEVVLMKPQLTIPAGISSQSGVIESLNPANATPLGSNFLVYDNLGLSVTGGNTLTLPLGAQGYYFVFFGWNGTSTPATAGGTLTFTNCTSNPILGTTNAGYGYGFTTTTVATTMVILIPDPTKQASILFGGGGTYPASGKSYVWVAQMPAQFIPS